jgi:cytochrome P450
MSKALSINFDSPEIIANPFPVYEEIRAAGRVVRNELLGAWMLPGYADVMAVSTNHAVYSNTVWNSPDKRGIMAGSAIMLNADPTTRLSTSRTRRSSSPAGLST